MGALFRQHRAAGAAIYRPAYGDALFAVVATGLPSTLASGVASASFAPAGTFVVAGSGTPSSLASGQAGVEFTVPPPADDAPLTAVELRQLFNWMRDLHMIHGLAVGAPLVVGQTSRVAGAISQTIEDVGGATVITRG